MEKRPEDEHEPLWSVDPGASVERLPPLPAARHLRVPPFVGGERSSPERQAQEDGHGGRSSGHSERWGPPRPDLDRRAAALALGGLGIALAAAWVAFGLALTVERLLLVLLVPALILGRARAYLRDFLPFAALIVLYAELRGLAHTLRPVPHYRPQLKLEQLLFAGRVPSAMLQERFWDGVRHWYDTLLVDVTRIHSTVPVVLAFVLWMRRRALFYRFAATMLVLSYAAALVFLFFPSAPPWAAAEAGFPVDVSRIGTALPSFSYLGPVSIYHFLDNNPYAAIPSLHGGYSFLVFLFVASVARHSRWRWPATAAAGLYACAQAFAAVYTGNHYVVDLLIGDVFAAGSMLAVGAFWRRRGLPE